MSFTPIPNPGSEDETRGRAQEHRKLQHVAEMDRHDRRPIMRQAAGPPAAQAVPDMGEEAVGRNLDQVEPGEKFSCL